MSVSSSAPITRHPLITRQPLIALLMLLIAGSQPACSDDSAPPGDGSIVKDGGSDSDSPVGDGPPFDCEAFDWPVAPEAVNITPHKSWKSTLHATSDAAFFVGEAGSDLEWVKFTIFLSQPEKVYFQDGNVYPFHYLFAKERLAPFAGINNVDFDAKTLHREGQVAVVGAVVLQRQRLEYGVQFERHEAYHPKMVKRLFESVKGALSFDAPATAFYMPTYHQRASVQETAHCYAQAGIQITDGTRWAKAGGCYSTGWAMGKVVFVKGDKIDSAYQDGTLTYRDILLTDAVPSEVPHVAGIITGTPSTPNSHVAILAQTFNVPFGYSAEAFAAAKALIGKEAIVRVRRRCEVDIAETVQMDAKTRAYLEDLKKTKPIGYVPITAANKLSVPVAGLTTADVATVGGKAAGFGVLHAAVPDNMPKPAIALTFDLYTAFMSQTLSSGKTLRQTIDSALTGYSFPPDIKKLATTLKTIRDTIKNKADFDSGQKAALIGILEQAGFDENKKIRFRSSTNVEDGKHFTGAGLYDSKSGCLADDKDSDNDGPSRCDSGKKKEAGVFRALRKVYASFYNVNAFLERLRHGVDETKVGMAVLVHHSFPDPEELANGVIIYRHDGEHDRRLEIVSQRGATSVTNPKPGVTPEVVTAFLFDTKVYPRLVKHSSLPPLAKPVLDFPSEYELLGQLVDKVRTTWAAQNGAPTRYALDLEYKKVTPGKLVIKQVRSLPQPDTSQTLTPVLAAAKHQVCTYQGENSDVFAIHRLKSRWQSQPRTILLDSAGLATSFYVDMNITYLDGAYKRTLKGDPTTFPNATHVVTQEGVEETFTVGTGPAQRVFVYRVQVPQKVSPQDTPIVLLKDLNTSFEVRYKTAVPFVHPNTTIDSRSEELVRLESRCPSDPLSGDAQLQERTINAPKGLTATISFYWPPNPKQSAGYTAPLVAWGKVRISGLTTTPIELSGDYAASYRPGHHNFVESFAFEPRLDPSVPQASLAELAAKNIRVIYMQQDTGANGNTVYVLGTDGTLRSW